MLGTFCVPWPPLRESRKPGGKLAERLHLTQSALSHQLKDLGRAPGLPLFVAQSKPVRSTSGWAAAAGLADKPAPALRYVRPNADLQRPGGGQGGSGCIWPSSATAAFKWLMPTIRPVPHALAGRFEVDFASEPFFLCRPCPRWPVAKLDIWSSPPIPPGRSTASAYVPLFTYEAVLASATSIRWSRPHSYQPAEFAGETLISYPWIVTAWISSNKFSTPPASSSGHTQCRLNVMNDATGPPPRGVCCLPKLGHKPNNLHRAANVTARPLGADGPVRQRSTPPCRERHGWRCPTCRIFCSRPRTPLSQPWMVSSAKKAPSQCRHIPHLCLTLLMTFSHLP